MLKTTVKNPARFGAISKALIVYSVLREYVNHPLAFLVGTALTVGRFKKRLPKDIPNDFVELFAFPTWIYMRLKERMGQEEAFALARAIIIPLGVAVYGAEFCLVEAPRTWNNFIDFVEISNRQGAIRWSKVEMDERTETLYEYRCTFCMIHHFLSKLGIPELTEPFCTLDNALYNAYLPNEIIFHRGGKGKTIEKGQPFCKFIHERKIQ
ncbi:L-2-amino-thiazoline-4-carboxylic acid hydrolase [Candidatus Poribacteria bacterium]|nr:L-2-amino-thiazoline-4-carboxylic acid hydrolase [Candidatus Poribacteria bacterium]